MYTALLIKMNNGTIELYVDNKTPDGQINTWHGMDTCITPESIPLFMPLDFTVYRSAVINPPITRGSLELVVNQDLFESMIDRLKEFLPGLDITVKSNR